MATITGKESAVFSQVDSERFGVRVARAHVVAENLPQLMDFCAAERIVLLIARCAASELRTAQAEVSERLLRLPFYNDLTDHDLSVVVDAVRRFSVGQKHRN